MHCLDMLFSAGSVKYFGKPYVCKDEVNFAAFESSPSYVERYLQSFIQKNWGDCE